MNEPARPIAVWGDLMLDAPIDRILLHDADLANYEIEIEIRDFDFYYGSSKALMSDYGIRAAFEASVSR